MSRNIRTVLPVGPDGMPIGLGGGGSSSLPTGAALDTSLQAILQAVLNIRTKGATAVIQVTFDLSTARTAQVIPLPTGMGMVYGVTVRRLTGPAAGTVRLHLGGPTVQGLEVSEGDDRENLTIPALAIANDGTGGSLQIEIHGGAA